LLEVIYLKYIAGLYVWILQEQKDCAL